MSNIPSAASAAALAAFNATAKSKDTEPNKSPPPMCTIDKNISIQSLPTATSKTNKKVISPRPSGPGLQISMPSPGMRRSSTLDVPGTVGQRSSTSPGQNVRKSPLQSPRTVSDSGSIAASGDYFSESYKQHNRIPSSPREMINNVKHSIDSKAIVNDASAKRLSSNYSPQEMIKSLRSSINSKAKSSQVVLSEKSSKGQQILNDMRDRIDTQMRKVSESSSNLAAATRVESNLRPISNNSNKNCVYETNNNSYSSLGSSFSERASVTINVGEEEDCEEAQIEDEKEQAEANGQVKSVQDTESSTVGEAKSEDKSKPRRKPPPEMSDQERIDPKSTHFYIGDDINKSSDAFSSTSSLVNVDDEGYDIEDMRFPQFPRVKKRSESKSNIFKKKKMKEIDPSILIDSEEEESLPPTLSSSALVQAPPVQFKTTMRETKRKDKKTQFNENKPWKSHSELNYLTEQERKRYKGVWASNKGNYMSQVVTKLVGVDYSLIPEVVQENEEISKQAAKLSNNQAQNVSDQDNLHQLENVDINQLIHGVVVQRIWGRSRLPDDTLEQIWNLVDFRKDGTLNKNEFLVGMWLVDQCLYGRKLPKKVDPIVWDSLGGIGVNVSIKKKVRR